MLKIVMAVQASARFVEIGSGRRWSHRLPWQGEHCILVIAVWKVLACSQEICSRKSVLVSVNSLSFIVCYSHANILLTCFFRIVWRSPLPYLSPQSSLFQVFLSLFHYQAYFTWFCSEKSVPGCTPWCTECTKWDSMHSRRTLCPFYTLSEWPVSSQLMASSLPLIFGLSCLFQQSLGPADFFSFNKLWHAIGIHLEYLFAFGRPKASCGNLK